MENVSAQTLFNVAIMIASPLITTIAVILLLRFRRLSSTFSIAITCLAVSAFFSWIGISAQVLFILRIVEPNLLSSWSVMLGVTAIGNLAARTGFLVCLYLGLADVEFRLNMLSQASRQQP